MSTVDSIEPPQSIDATRTRGIAAPDHDLPSRLRESMSGELAIVYTKRDYGCRESGPRSRAERDKSSRSVGEYAGQRRMPMYNDRLEFFFSESIDPGRFGKSGKGAIAP